MIELCCEYLSVDAFDCMILSCHVHIQSESTLLFYRVQIHSEYVRNMIKTYSQTHRSDKYSQHSSIIWCSFNELSGCVFEPSCQHLKMLLNIELLNHLTY